MILAFNAQNAKCIIEASDVHNKTQPKATTQQKINTQTAADGWFDMGALMCNPCKCESQQSLDVLPVESLQSLLVDPDPIL